MSRPVLDQIINNFVEISEVIDCINNGGTPLFTSEEVAGQYIATYIEDDEFESVRTLVKCHYDNLVHWGMDSRFCVEEILKACECTLKGLDEEYFGEG